MTILERFAQLPIWLRLLIKALLIAVLGIIDHLTGYEIAFSIFYLVPVAVTAWIDGRAAGIAISLVSSAVWLLTDLTAGHEYSQPWIPFWNMGVRMGFFAIVAIILARLRAALERERDLARIDGLTQIWNAHYFLEVMHREIQRCARSARPITVAYLDLDNFKQVNDTQGHAQGDALLQAIGIKLRQELRSIDFAGRLGGDEFALLLPETDYQQAAAALRRVKSALDALLHASNVTVSMGAVTFQNTGAGAEDMLKAADELMYSVKRSGKNSLRHELVAAPAAEGPRPPSGSA